MGKKRSPAYKKTKRFLKQIIGKDIWSSAQIKINKTHYGDWVFCPDALDANSVIYSLGVGEDIDFDRQIIKDFGVTVRAFDPTPNSIEWLKATDVSDSFEFHPYGVSSIDGQLKLYPRVNRRGRKSKVMYTLIDEDNAREDAIIIDVKTLSTIMSELDHATIDLLKMDIEGAEFEVLDLMIESNLDVRQILVEFHHRFETIGKAKASELIGKLNNAGYKIFFICDKGRNYSFIKV